GKRLLFPGDAQIENWSYALSKASVRTLLGDVAVYKVGHHGSLNATPKASLWPLFKRRARKRSPDRLATLLSTMADKHGSTARGTEVPRSVLVAALGAESDLFNTEDLDRGALYHVQKISFS